MLHYTQSYENKALLSEDVKGGILRVFLIEGTSDPGILTHEFQRSTNSAARTSKLPQTDTHHSNRLAIQSILGI